MSWQDIEDEQEKYAAYLCSREWAEKRELVRDRCGDVCERCGNAPMQVVHHLTYLRKYDERIEDLAGWCRKCHDFNHGKSNSDPAKARQPTLSVSLRKFNNAKGDGASMMECPICGSETIYPVGSLYEKETGNFVLSCVCEQHHGADLIVQTYDNRGVMYWRNTWSLEGLL